MDSCLLCLEIRKDIVDYIRVNSKQWQELDIEKTIEKHFWSLNNRLPNSWLCLSCWREVSTFHKFYIRVEEAHINFGKLKMETCVMPIDSNEELLTQKINIKNNDRELDKNDVSLASLAFLEPEILIDQIELPQSEEITFVCKTDIAEPLEKLDLNTAPISKTCKRIKVKNNVTRKDPLEKSYKAKNKKSKAKLVKDEILQIKTNLDFKLKEELENIKNDNNSDSVSDIDNNVTDINKDSTHTQTVESKRRVRKEHDEFIAKNFKEMFCAICQVQFKDFQFMQKHFTDSHKQRGYVVCCKRKFFDRARLVDHLHCHLNPDHFKCNQCGKVMSDRTRLVKHMLRVHRANEVVKEHCCNVCGKSFTEAYVLRTHKLTHLPDEEKKFPCSDCGKNYGSSYLLNQHRQVVHLKRFVRICYICGKAINSSVEFKSHMDKHEGLPTPVINCDVCGLRLTSKRSLKLHKETQHPVGGKQDHPCFLCGKISPTARALKKHINTMHEKGLDHKCTLCQKAFRRPETLKDHMASHTGTPLYVCPWCPKTFYSNGNMHAHRKNKHPKEYLESKLQKYN